MATLAQRAEARARRLGLRGPQVRPWVLPGAPLVHELRWRVRLAAARPVDLDRYGATLRLHEREVLLPCHLCGATRVKPLFHVRDT